MNPTTCKCPAFTNQDGSPSTHALGLQDQLGGRYCDSSQAVPTQPTTLQRLAELRAMMAEHDGATR